ncbi:protein O-mannosyl-transferase family [Anabaena sp. CS-542/02]|uniref:protein O-mannosyl-transferase family n=1 Tax=Anabaena sp. CS-542/02 TaxID=3021719 RepID=UPI00232B69E4|nr:glycosyltransferase family 39 protein [Anabaena sp. CS-542/02]MDB9445003.1 glycosyltransferase family 39 protein [Anabaena sp. CS-542/02]
MITVLETILLFVFSLLVYLANGATISSGDTAPNTLLAFNFLENHTLHLDAFKQSYLCTVSYGSCYFFAEANNGHLTSAYPIGTAIVTFPLYVIFYLYLKLTEYLSVPIDLTSVSFEVHRLFFEKLAASITTAFTVSIFYLSLRLKFKRGLSLVTTFIFAFATNTWMTSSQGLWQHGISNLALVSIIFCLLKANRAKKHHRNKWLILAGIACGLLPGIRPTSAVYTIGAIIYSVFTYRRQAIFLFSGLITAVPSIVWNLYYFNNLVGGYSSSHLFSESPYSLNNFIESSLGTLISPGRGLLIFSPILVYSLLGAYQICQRKYDQDDLIGCMSVAGFILLFSYFLYRFWWAGHSYGPRFMTDILPIFCYLISYYLVNIFPKVLPNYKIISLKLFIFITLGLFSTLVQLAGAFAYNPGVLWNAIPLNVDLYHHRLWDIKDSQIERNMRASLNQIIKPNFDNATYIQGLDGVIQKITDDQDQPIQSLISVPPGYVQVFKANLKNTGVSRWVGYKSAVVIGETRIRGRFLNEKNNLISEVRMFVSGNPRTNELVNAIGSINFPPEPGKYKLNFDLIAEGVSEFPKINDKSLYVINVDVIKPK